MTVQPWQENPEQQEEEEGKKNQEFGLGRGSVLSIALRGHVTSFLWKWQFYDFAFTKPLVGHILNKIIVIQLFKPAPFS